MKLGIKGHTVSIPVDVDRIMAFVQLLVDYLAPILYVDLSPGADFRNLTTFSSV